MKLKKYIKALRELEKAGHGNLEVVCASDDEGNSYNDVFYTPGVMTVSDLNEYRGSSKGEVICLN